VDLHVLHRERLQKSLEAEVRELRGIHFSRVRLDGVERFAVSSHPLPGAELIDDGWQIRRLDTESLVFHRGGDVVGEIPAGLPAFQPPSLDWAVIAELFLAAMTIALIGFMEAIAIAKGMAARTRQHLDANQELIGQGIGNIAGSLFQSYPTAGSFSRSAVNIDAGAVTGFSSVVTSLVVAMVLLWLTPLLYHLPQATLAAVIMMAVIGLVRFAPMRHAWKVERNDGMVAVVTFVLTLLLAPHLEQGILIGVLLSLGLYLYRSMYPRVAVLGRHSDGSLRDAQVHGLAACPNITILRFDGSLYFANTSYFEEVIQRKIASKPELEFVIVDAEGINHIDATGEEMLRQVVERLEEAGITLLFSRMKKQVRDVLERSGFVARVGEGAFFSRTEYAIEYAWAALGPDHAADCPLARPATCGEAGAG